MIQRFFHRHHILAALTAFLFGVGLCAGAWRMLHGSYPVVFSDKAFFAVASDEDLHLELEKGESILVDLEAREVALVSDGVRTAHLPIIHIPAKGSPWEISRGTFAVEAKEEVHRSRIAADAFPNAVSFGGNMFIHGNRNALEVARDQGGLELSHADADRLYAFAKIGMKVRVVGEGRVVPHLLIAQAATTTETDGYRYFANEYGKKEISADAYLVGDIDTGEVLLSHNATAVRPIASVSKLFTALVAQDVRSVKTPPKSTRLGLSYSDLLYPMLLESNNFAAEELARLGGGEAFIKGMNEKASALGLTHTSFRDSSGLSPLNVSTAEDLFSLAKYIYHDQPDLLATTRLAAHDGWHNKNVFIVAKDERYIGGKVGYIPEAGQTWVAFFSLPVSEFKNKHIAVVLLRSPNRVRDAKNILAELSRNLYAEGGEGAAFAGVYGTANSADTHENTLLFVGDLMLDRGVESVVNRDCKGDFSCLFEYADFLKSADLTFANLEGPVSDKGYDLHNLYSFRMNPTVLAAIRGAGFDVLSLANNHVGDWGRSAFEDTIARVRDAGIAAVGAGLSAQDAEQVKVVEKNGIKFGFLGASDVGPEWLGTPDNLPVVLLANNPRLKEIIAKAKESCDVLVVSFHFGEEYRDAPTKRQQELAHLAIDAGASIVVGHHPHVREPIEYYKGGVIDYSLGNFIFDQDFSLQTKEGGVLVVKMNGTSTASVTEYIAKQNKLYQPLLQGDYDF